VQPVRVPAFRRTQTCPPDLHRRRRSPSAAVRHGRRPGSPPVEFVVSSPSSRCFPRGERGTPASNLPCTVAPRLAPPLAAGQSPLPALAQHWNRLICNRRLRSDLIQVNRRVPVNRRLATILLLKNPRVSFDLQDGPPALEFSLQIGPGFFVLPQKV
jgi:hypothetical protein